MITPLIICYAFLFNNISNISAIENSYLVHSVALKDFNKVAHENVVKYHESIPLIQDAVLGTVTAYTDHDEQVACCYGSDGTKLYEGVIAASPDMIAKWGYGASVIICGVGKFKIHDKMPAYNKKTFDVYMIDRRKAIEFGRKFNLAILRVPE